MAEVVVALNQISARWADAMFAVVWQSALLTCIAALVLLAWRRPSPAVRCWVWRLLAIKFLVMPFWAIAVPQPRWLVASSNPSAEERLAIIPAPRHVPRETDAGNAARTIAQAVPPGYPDVATRIVGETWLVAIWLAVIVIQVARLGWQHWRLQQLLSESRLVDERLHTLVEDCSRRLPLPKPPETRITIADVSPFICGMARPVLVLPESLVNSAEQSQLRQVVLHELAHVRRHDLVWCWIAQVMRMMYWFHPVAHWVAFREALERELACDEMAMARSGASAGDYARTLVDAAGRIAMPAALRAATAAHLDGGFPGR